VANAEWEFVRALIRPAKPGGRKRTVDFRELLNGILYLLSTGCHWRALPSETATRMGMGQALHGKVVSLAGRLPQIRADPANTDARCKALLPCVIERGRPPLLLAPFCPGHV
jgi:transposase